MSRISTSKRDDDHRRRDDDSRLAAGERLIDLTRLGGKLSQFLAVERCHGGGGSPQIETGLVGYSLDLRVAEHPQQVGSIGRRGRDMLLQRGVDGRLACGVAACA